MQTPSTSALVKDTLPSPLPPAMTGATRQSHRNTLVVEKSHTTVAKAWVEAVRSTSASLHEDPVRIMISGRKWLATIVGLGTGS